MYLKLGHPGMRPVQIKGQPETQTSLVSGYYELQIGLILEHNGMHRNVLEEHSRIQIGFVKGHCESENLVCWHLGTAESMVMAGDQQ